MSRNFTEVCNKVWACVPEDLRTVEDRGCMRWLVRSSRYTPPEMMWERWKDLTIFTNSIVEPSEDTKWEQWMVDMYAALSDKTSEFIWADINQRKGD